MVGDGCVADSKDSGTASSEDGDRPPHQGLDTASEWSESRPDSGPDSPECLFERPPHLLHPAYHLQHHGAAGGRLPPSATTTPPPPAKPRIWSLADMASKESEPPAPASSAFYTAGKLMSPLATRSVLHPHHLHHPAVAYARPAPHDLYRSFYGSAGHLVAAAAAAGGSAADASLLETYSRTFGGAAAATRSPPCCPRRRARRPSGAARSGSPSPRRRRRRRRRPAARSSWRPPPTASTRRRTRPDRSSAGPRGKSAPSPLISSRPPDPPSQHIGTSMSRVTALFITGRVVHIFVVPARTDTRRQRDITTESVFKTGSLSVCIDVPFRYDMTVVVVRNTMRR
ncbi:hypothetical protein PR048_003204 [Dryococelus australis]|uniref:Iroquois-class homeodomain protein domain-containing protein n=1 Tax=Dryococelus australis TaxID=614101 RepID=A0ABQ9IMG6_9NEOP|nr:hypothetical protein PR048_003204 [Dryococelus australis]